MEKVERQEVLQNVLFVTIKSPAKYLLENFPQSFAEI